MNITEPPFRVGLDDGKLSGKEVVESSRTIGDLEFLFEDEAARKMMDQDQIVYRVEALLPVEEGSEGGLFFGRTIVEPGKVGDEYFMTKGHFHLKEDRSEFYWGIQGMGMLILMDRNRKVWAERMVPGSLHYIHSHIAHRTVNIGTEPLIFEACWPSDAGHNYQEIAQKGFAGRLKEIDGQPKLVAASINENFRPGI